jgi:hypothetical protein
MPKPNLVANFPMKEEPLSKTNYGIQRAALVAADAANCTKKPHHSMTISPFSIFLFL